MRTNSYNIKFLKVKIICFLMLMYFPEKIVGQYYQIKKFTIEDGLPSNIITNVFQDSKGYIWFKSGYEKICRYDGKTFLKFSNSNGINGEDAFFEDSLGLIHTGSLFFSKGNFIKHENDTIRNLNIVYYGDDGGAAYNDNSGFMDRWGGNWKIGFDGFIYRNFKGKNIKINTEYGLPPKFYETIKASKLNKLNVYVDKNRNVWITSNLGAYFFNGKQLEFSGIKQNNVFAEKDSKSRIWIRAYDGSNDEVVLFQNNELIHFDKKLLGIKSFGRNLLEDAKGKVWITAGDDGLLVYQNNNIKKVNIIGNYLIKGINKKGELILFKSSDNSIYTFDGALLNKIISLKNYEIDQYQNFLIDREDNIWISSENGLLLITKSDVGYTPFTEYKNFDASKKDIRHLFTSTKGKIYLFNYQRGIFLLEKDSLISLIDDVNLYPEDVIEDKKGVIWITSRSISDDNFYKIFKINNATCEVVNLNHLKKTCDTKKIGLWPKFFINNAGNVCLASGHLGLIEFNSDNLYTFYQLPDSKLEKFQGQLIEDFKKDKAIFKSSIASKTKLILFDEKTKTFQEIIDQNEKLPNYFIGTYSLNNKILLFGSKEGFYIIENQKIKSISYNDSLKMLELGSKIWTDDVGHIWYLVGDEKALMGGRNYIGLNEIFFDKTGILHAKFYNENSGLSSNSVSSIFIKDYPNIWMAVGGLLNKLNVNTGKINVFDYKFFGGDNNLFSIENSKNTLYSFSTSGIVKIDYFFKTKNIVPPLVDIIEIGYEYVGEGQNKTVKKWEYDFPINLELEYKNNNVFFEIRGLSYNENEKVHYKYMLEGYDKTWSDSTYNTFIKYTNLPEGHYTLNVFASNNSNIWSKTPAQFQFTILAPWYRTWLAYILYLTLASGSIYLLVKYRTRKLVKEKKKLEEIVEERTKEIIQEKIIIEEQKHLIEEKHKEITDSINYAERIQRSFLATKEQLDEKLNDYFILFKPKDVVSGDFYWAHTLHNGNFALVTADSTGHGVPGAIMSLLNTSSLERAVESGFNEPAEILNHTRQTIIQRLKKDGSFDGGKDGMDCSLISFNIDKNKLIYAAANNPVWIIRNSELIELTYDKIPVGRHDRDSISFTQHEIALQKNDMIYTLTDGFPDQFGGPNGKKFMYKKLKDTLISISNKKTSEQKEILNNILKEWMGNIEQVDDITVIGIKI